MTRRSDAPPAMPPAGGAGCTRPRRLAPLEWLQRLSPTARGLLWSAAAGAVFSVLNALMRALAQHLEPFQAQFLRYLFGLVVLLPLVWRRGAAAYRPKRVSGQFKEPMRWERWLAAAIGFGGVLIVVGPKLGGGAGAYHLVMLASAPMFAASFLLTKGLTRYETTGTILVWQSLTVTLFSLPLALPGWQAPTGWQWAGFLVCGFLGSLGHYCLTRSFRAADISATQSVKFLDLVWASLIGWLVFADLPSRSTLLGGAVICAATIWIALRESRGDGPADAGPAVPAPRT